MKHSLHRLIGIFALLAAASWLGPAPPGRAQEAGRVLLTGCRSLGGQAVAADGGRTSRTRPPAGLSASRPLHFPLSALAEHPLLLHRVPRELGGSSPVLSPLDSAPGRSPAAESAPPTAPPTYLPRPFVRGHGLRAPPFSEFPSLRV